MLPSSIALVGLLCLSGCSLAQQINLGYRYTLTSLLTVALAPVVSSSTVLHSTSFYYGFSHFVTTVNDLVIVFTPSAGIPDDTSSVSTSTVTSIRTVPTQDRTASTSVQDRTVLSSMQHRTVLSSMEDRTVLSSMEDRTVLSSMKHRTVLSSVQDRTVLSSVQDRTVLSSVQDKTASHLLPLEASFQTALTSATCISGCSLRSNLLALGEFEGTTAAVGLDAHESRASETWAGSHIPSNNYFERFSQLIFESVSDSSAVLEMSESSVRFQTWTGSSAREWAGDSSSVYRVGTAWPVQSAGAASAAVLDVTVEPAAVPLPPETRVLLTQGVGYRVRARPTSSALPETDVTPTPSAPSQHRLELVEHFHNVGVVLPTTSRGSTIITDQRPDALPLEKLFHSLASRQGSVAVDASRDRVPHQQLFGKRRWSAHQIPDDTFNSLIY